MLIEQEILLQETGQEAMTYNTATKKNNECIAQRLFFEQHSSQSSRASKAQPVTPYSSPQAQDADPTIQLPHSYGAMTTFVAIARELKSNKRGWEEAMRPRESQQDEGQPIQFHVDSRRMPYRDDL